MQNGIIPANRMESLGRKQTDHCGRIASLSVLISDELDFNDNVMISVIIVVLSFWLLSFLTESSILSL